MADKKNTSKQIERNNKLDREINDRHNDNARAAADPASNTPRINTDNL
ncbi:hypothetical protein [Neobacillus sp. FSL H8-0543]